MKSKEEWKQEERQLSIEHMQLILDDLNEERRDSLITVLDYVAELEAKLNERADLAADIPVIAHNAELPQFDPVYVRTLQQAYSEMVTHTASIEDENKRLTELLRGDRMVVATRINHEYTNAKGVIRELQTENERLRAILENTRQQRDDAYQERVEAQRWQPVQDGECNLNVTEMITVSGKGKWLRCGDLVDNIEVGVTLPDDIRLCRKVQP